MRENSFGAHFLQLYHKNEYGEPHFLLHDFNKDSPSFSMRKKLAQIYVQFFGNFTKLYGGIELSRVEKSVSNSILLWSVK